jgi:hypothetical protein
MCSASRLIRLTKGCEAYRVVVRPNIPRPHAPCIHTPMPALHPGALAASAPCPIGT